MPSIECLSLIQIKIVLIIRSLIGMLLVGIKAIKLSQLLHFFFYCPHNGCLHPRTTVVHLWEVKKEDFNREEKMLGPQIGVHLWGVFTSGKCSFAAVRLKLQPRTELLGTPKEIALLVQFFKVRWHYLFFETPLPRKSMLTDRCESQWFEINIDLGVWRGRRRQSSFSSKTVKCPKSCDQGCSSCH